MAGAKSVSLVQQLDDIARDPVENPWRGRLLIAVAAVLWSTSGFFAKSPWFDVWPEEIRGTMLGYWRSFFALLILVPMIRRPVWRPQLLSMVFCFAVMVWSFMTAMVHGPAANAIWLQYLSPAWVLLGGVWLLKEKITSADVLMFLFCLSGVGLILGMEMGKGDSFYATAMGLLSGITFAGVVLSIRSMRDVDPAWLITLNHLAVVLLLGPWVWWRTEQLEWTGYLGLGFFGVFQMSIPYVLFAKGLRSTSSPEASVLTLIEPLLVPVWVFLAWHNHPSYQAPNWWTWAGGGLILAGLLGRYVPPLLRSLRLKRRRVS